MQIVSSYLHEMSKPIFSENWEKKIKLSFADILPSMQ